jgi:DNA-binding NtrC family response regulator
MAPEGALRVVFFVQRGDTLPTSLVRALEGAGWSVVLSSTGALFASEPFDSQRVAEEPHGVHRKLAVVEWEYIHQVLSTFRGNVSQTARVLGIPRRSLQRKLQRNRPIERANADLG